MIDDFGRKMAENKRRNLKPIMKIYTVRGGGKYLRLPEQFGRKKTENLTLSCNEYEKTKTLV